MTHGTAVTGTGLVTPLGPSVADTVAAWVRGDVAGEARHRTRAGAPVRLASVARARVSVSLRAPKLEKYLSWPTMLAVRAAMDAWAAAGRPLPDPDGERVGVYVAAGTSALECDEFLPACAAAWTGPEPGGYGEVGGRPLRLLDPHFALRTLANGPAAFVSMELGARGPSAVFVQSSCAAAIALQAACDDLALGRAEAAVVVACDSLLEPTTILVRERAGHLDAAGAPALAEGAAALVLERGVTGAAVGTVEHAETFCGDDAAAALASWLETVTGAIGGDGRIAGATARVWWATSGTHAVPPRLVALLGAGGSEALDLTPRMGDLGAAGPLACAALALSLPPAERDTVLWAEAVDRWGALLVHARQ